MQLLQSVVLERGGRAVVGLVGQVVLEAVETYAAGGAFVIVGERQGGDLNAAIGSLPWSFLQTGSLTEVNRTVSFRAGAAICAGSDFLLYHHTKNGG